MLYFKSKDIEKRGGSTLKFLKIEELKKLDIVAASEYCEKLREYVIDTVSLSGGHLASNLGVAEISLALIRKFNSPYDKIIYDVGHQSYIHKLLTDRHFDSSNLRTFDGYSGFTKREESEHDPFGAGHSSTALSAALGFAKSANIKGENYYSIAVIGDGAFCTGMTFEALNNVSKNDRIIIILNDNNMSISKNVGSMASYLNKIRVTSGYLNFKNNTKKVFNKIPIFSTALTNFASSIKRVIKRIFLGTTFFEDLGIRYLGPADGNDLKTVEMLLDQAKQINSPVLIHLITKKGKGDRSAEKNPNTFHFVSPLGQTSSTNSFSKTFSKLLTQYSSVNKNTVAITAAMCDGTGLNQFKESFPERFFDVGICEEHAATFSAALSASGLLPFYAVYSTFFQRSYDQVLHDISLQKLKAVIALDRSGLVGKDGATHHGLYDVSMTLNLPNSLIYSPATFKEMEYAFFKCAEHPYLSVLRYPKGDEAKVSAAVFDTPYDFSVDVIKKCDVLLVSYGRITDEVLKAKVILEKNGFSVVVLKFLKLKPIDFKKVSKLISSLLPKLLCCVEEGMKIGGFSEYLVSNIQTDAEVKIVAIDEMFVPQGSMEELYDYCGLSARKIAAKVLKWM